MHLTEKRLSDPYRPGFHLTPPRGWMNDPNGLCFFQGEYHVFFQYTPESASGAGKRCWGHYAGKDLFGLSFRGTVLFPDSEKDRNGAFSGSALVTDEELLLYYTGNVEWEGDYDHTYAGREANTILVSSEDGEHFGQKLLLMSNKDYPAEYTCHVRDPKVWQTDGKIRMVQGGRLDGRNTPDGDKGAVLVLEKSEESPWRTVGSITTKQPFGYMWECPDYFEIGGQKYLSCCPQGLPSENDRWQNVYQSGYFRLPETFAIAKPERFRTIDDPEVRFNEWDMGFDFYAPQTFTDAVGRRILIGWAGGGDADYDNAPTVAHGWQHALTLPRELTLSETDGRIRQQPVAELNALRTDYRKATEYSETLLTTGMADIYAGGLSVETLLSREKKEDPAENENDGEGVGILSVRSASEVLFRLLLSRSGQGFRLTLTLSPQAGCGRKRRNALLNDIRDLRILIDRSIVEIYVNEGETVMTSRFYPSEDDAVKPYRLQLGGICAGVWDMKAAAWSR